MHPSLPNICLFFVWVLFLETASQRVQVDLGHEILKWLVDRTQNWNIWSCISGSTEWLLTSNAFAKGTEDVGDFTNVRKGIYQRSTTDTLCHDNCTRNAHLKGRNKVKVLILIASGQGYWVGQSQHRAQCGEIKTRIRQESNRLSNDYLPKKSTWTKRLPTINMLSW